MAGEKNFETRLKKWLESEGEIETIAGVLRTGNA